MQSDQNALDFSCSSPVSSGIFDSSSPSSNDESRKIGAKKKPGLKDPVHEGKAGKKRQRQGEKDTIHDIERGGTAITVEDVGRLPDTQATLPTTSDTTEEDVSVASTEQVMLTCAELK